MNEIEKKKGEMKKEQEQIKHVKALIQAYPLDLAEDEAEGIDVKNILTYCRSYITKLPIYIKLIDFTDHRMIKMCYDNFDKTGNEMSPEEALALLDG
jgi:hypothetical protein